MPWNAHAQKTKSVRAKTKKSATAQSPAKVLKLEGTIKALQVVGNKKIEKDAVLNQIGRANV